MDIWHISLALGAAIALALSAKTSPVSAVPPPRPLPPLTSVAGWKARACAMPRAWVWIGALVLSFAASDAYQSSGLPHQPVFVALCDTCVCLLIDRLAREKYEVLLFNVMRFSVLVSVVQFGGQVLFQVDNHYWTVVALEGVNWIALALIGGIGIHQWMWSDDRDGFSRRPHPGVLSLGHYLRQARRSASWLHR